MEYTDLIFRLKRRVAKLEVENLRLRRIIQNYEVGGKIDTSLIDNFQEQIEELATENAKLRKARRR